MGHQRLQQQKQAALWCTQQCRQLRQRHTIFVARGGIQDGEQAQGTRVLRGATGDDVLRTLARLPVEGLRIPHHQPTLSDL